MSKIRQTLKICALASILMVCSTTSHARSFISLQLFEEAFRIVHVQLVAMPGQQIGFERDVSAHVPHERQHDGRFEIVVIH